MKKGRIDRFYPSFTGEERFRLHLEALYRGDEAEVRRLLESCPRKSYVMNEVGYAYRCKASKEIVEILDRVIAPLLAKLEMIESFRETLPEALTIYTDEALCAYHDSYQAGARRAWEAAGKIGDPPGWKERKGDGGDKGPERDRETQSLRNLAERLVKVSGVAFSHLEELERKLLEEALTLWTAFAHCCSEECGVEPEKLIKVWFEPMLSEIERLKHLSDSTELNPRMLKEYKAAFKKVWSEIADRA